MEVECWSNCVFRKEQLNLMKLGISTLMEKCCWEMLLFKTQNSLSTFLPSFKWCQLQTRIQLFDRQHLPYLWPRWLKACTYQIQIVFIYSKCVTIYFVVFLCGSVQSLKLNAWKGNLRGGRMISTLSDGPRKVLICGTSQSHSLWFTLLSKYDTLPPPLTHKAF